MDVLSRFDRSARPVAIESGHWTDRCRQQQVVSACRHTSSGRSNSRRCRENCGQIPLARARVHSFPDRTQWAVMTQSQCRQSSDHGTAASRQMAAFATNSKTTAKENSCSHVCGPAFRLAFKPSRPVEQRSVRSYRSHEAKPQNWSAKEQATGLVLYPSQNRAIPR